MSDKLSFLALIVALLALGVVLLRSPGQIAAPQKQETVFDHVIQTRTIRCGYAIWDPVLYRDVKTAEMHGIAHDIMEEIGKKLDLHIEWAEEAGWGTIVEGLSAHRYDMICNTLGVIATRARAIDFSTPVFYAGSYLVVRADENRILKNEDVDNSAYSVAVLEGEAFSYLAPKLFPKAHVKAVPQNTEWSLIFQDLDTKKSDVTGVSLSDFIQYDKANPGKLKILDRSHPVQVYAASFGLPQGDIAFKTMIDAALDELAGDGTIDRTLRAYASSPDEFLSPVKPYALPAP